MDKEKMINVVTFESERLPDALRDAADWIDNESPYIWSFDAQEDVSGWQVYVYYYPATSLERMSFEDMAASTASLVADARAYISNLIERGV